MSLFFHLIPRTAKDWERIAARNAEAYELRCEQLREAEKQRDDLLEAVVDALREKARVSSRAAEAAGYIDAADFLLRSFTGDSA